MNLTLNRYGSIPSKGTFGEITVNDQKFYTIEREWLDNQAGVSCVPKGHYTLVPHSSRSYPETWALVNEDLGVYHYEDPEAIRTAILFHIANWQKNVRGCIGLGFGLGGSWNVTDSADATNHFLAMLAQESEHLLEIT